MTRFALLSISFILFTAFTVEKIDFKHKRIQKEISKTFEVKDFTIDEVPINDSSIFPESLIGKFFNIYHNQEVIGYSYVGRVNSCRAGGCTVSIDIEDDRPSEYFDYFILFDTSRKIKAVRVYNYQATHGHEITAKSWLKQFDNYSGDSDLIVGKNIDAISGATISTHAIAYDVQLKSTIFNNFH